MSRNARFGAPMARSASRKPNTTSFGVRSEFDGRVQDDRRSRRVSGTATAREHQCFVGADPDEIDEINRGVVFSPCAGAADHDGEIGSAERSTGRFYRPPIAAGAWPQTVSRQRYTPS